MSNRFFGRLVKLNVGPPGKQGKQWEDLRIAFSCEKKVDKQPNKAEIKVYNLSEDSIAYIQTSGHIAELYAGYEDIGIERIFIGDITRVTSRFEDADRVTTLEVMDGGNAYQSARFNRSYAKGVSLKQILQNAAKDMGMSLKGNIPDIMVNSGRVVHGLARDELPAICNSMGLLWSVQDNVLTVMPPRGNNGQPTVSLGSGQGLVGSPTIGEKTITLTSLLNPKVQIGRRLQLQSETISGILIPQRIRHYGDKGWDTAFYTEAECIVEGSKIYTGQSQKGQTGATVATPAAQKDTGVPLESEEHTPEIGEVIEDTAKGIVSEVRTCCPGIVKAYNASKQTVDVEVVQRDRYKDGQSMLPPVIANVPVCFPQGGGFSLTYPLNAGDNVILVFSQRSIDEWKTKGGRDILAQDMRRFHLSDAMAIPGIVPMSAPNAVATSNSMVVGQNAGVKVKFQANKVTIGNGTVELLALIDSVLAQLIVLANTPAVPGSPINPAVATAITTIKTSLAAIKGV